MTTEILRNNLFKYKQESNKNQLDFEMDFDTELACIVYDEIHYINDNDRGSVWKEVYNDDSRYNATYWIICYYK